MANPTCPRDDWDYILSMSKQVKAVIECTSHSISLRGRAVVIFSLSLIQNAE